MGDDLRRLADLLQRVAQLTDRPPVVRRAQLDEVDRVAHEQGGVVEGVVELVGDARRELAERGQFSRLDELLLFLTQLLLRPLHLGRGLPQVPHDVNHGLALVGEALVELVQVAHDVAHRAALFVAFPQAPLQQLHVGAEFSLGRRGRLGLRDRALTIRDRGLRHRDQILPALSLSTSLRKLSSCFSRAIIFSSRPTTTSSNFSRSRIFSCSSLLDCSRSWTTCVYSRMSRKMPMAPITLPSGSRSAEALRLVGMTSPLALRGFRPAFRMTPRSTTSRSAAVNSRVSSRLMKRESDCSSTSSCRNPSSWETASLACRIFPSRSETNTGSGALAMMMPASSEPRDLTALVSPSTTPDCVLSSSRVVISALPQGPLGAAIASPRVPAEDRLSSRRALRPPWTCSPD